ncbi:DUF1700 domain-containing protein [Massilia arenosa]|uniref:DUF1700 domain-containing protein n=1 Tax=Zemynaea arenosa TaxID=2561931 RepID=A0A4Y9ST85_9BURK|nr:DUF1700 domain-containing protein [Massilia arenosa]TFW29831.1 DUF1700 domain-containing protein [Massilia arenosa]
MGKQEYIDALRQALAGLPPETVAKTLAYYEQRYVDGVAAGRTEEDVGRELDDPRKIAMTLRANAHLHAFQEKRTPLNLGRLLVSGTALTIFNLFMIIPAMVFASLLAALFACSFAFYIGGVAVTASGLAGTNEIVLDGPLKFLQIETDGPDAARVTVGPGGIHIQQDRESVRIGPGGITDENEDVDADADEREPAVVRNAERIAGRGVHIYTDMDNHSRTTQALSGLGMVVGGIALFLLGIVITRMSLSAFRRYVEMNISLLKGS